MVVRNTVVVKVAVVIVAVIVCMVISGCGGGSGAKGISGYGTLAGNVFVPGSGLVGANGAGNRSEPPLGYVALSDVTVTATVNHIDYTGVTDLKGHYSIPMIPAGSASVRITPPSGSGYREYTTTVNIPSKEIATIGLDGAVSLLSTSANNLSVTADSVDISQWPIVTATVSVLDPKADAGVLGMGAGNFTFTVGGGGVTVTSIHTEMTTGPNPRLIYVLTGTASGSRPTQTTAKLVAYYCGRTGSADRTVEYEVPETFLDPMSSTTVSYGFKDPNYANAHPGKWHLGTDLTASEGTKVSAVAKGYVVFVLTSGQDTSVVVKHRVTTDQSTTGGPTRDIYVFYGCITPIVGAGSTVVPGQEIGTLRYHSEGSHLHLALRVGENIASTSGEANLVGGVIPPADANGLTDGWTDPTIFLHNKTPDNTWNPGT